MSKKPTRKSPTSKQYHLPSLRPLTKGFQTADEKAPTVKEIYATLDKVGPPYEYDSSQLTVRPTDRVPITEYDTFVYPGPLNTNGTTHVLEVKIDAIFSSATIGMFCSDISSRYFQSGVLKLDRAGTIIWSATAISSVGSGCFSINPEIAIKAGDVFRLEWDINVPATGFVWFSFSINLQPFR